MKSKIFKNTPLIQEGGTTIYSQDSKKSLKDTEKFLKRVATSVIGITVKKVGNFFELKIGGFKEIDSGGAPGASASISIGGTFHYNTIMVGYSAYTLTRSIYFKTLLDKNTLNHIHGKVSRDVYDKIQYYDDSVLDQLAKTIFKVDDYYVFGYYIKKKKKFYLIKFTN